MKINPIYCRKKGNLTQYLGIVLKNLLELASGQMRYSITVNPCLIVKLFVLIKKHALSVSNVSSLGSQELRIWGCTICQKYWCVIHITKDDLNRIFLCAAAISQSSWRGKLVNVNILSQVIILRLFLVFA